MRDDVWPHGVHMATLSILGKRVPPQTTVLPLTMSAEGQPWEKFSNMG